jgi:hypothetical protein
MMHDKGKEGWLPHPFDQPMPWPMHLLQQLFEQQKLAMI